PTPISRSAVEIHPESEWELFIYQLGADKWCIGSPLRDLHMPKGTRISALFRGETLLHPSGSTVLEAGDILCVIAHEVDLPALGELFSQAPEEQSPQRFFGDFQLDGAVRLSALAPIYGLTLDGVDDQSLGDYLSQELGDKLVVGDQLDWQGIRWTVADMEDHEVRRVGVRLLGELEEE
ncbi:TrkA C-terminal domain-containing protein, partial [Aeromonas simiae]